MHISYYTWCIHQIFYGSLSSSPRQLFSDWKYSISMRPYFVVFVGIILQRELRTPGVISLCHKMTLHMSARGPLYDVNKTLTEAFHYIIMQLSFHNPNTDIVVQWTQPEICVTSWEVSPSSTTQGFSKCMHSISMRPYCMVCGSHFPTWGKHSKSYFFISYTNSPYACVGLIEQREISTPRVISLYHVITTHKSVWGASYNVRWALLELFHYNTISVSSMSPFLMAHGRHYVIEYKSFRSHVFIQ